LVSENVGSNPTSPTKNAGVFPLPYTLLKG